MVENNVRWDSATGSGHQPPQLLHPMATLSCSDLPLVINVQQGGDTQRLVGKEADPSVPKGIGEYPKIVEMPSESMLKKRLMF